MVMMGCMENVSVESLVEELSSFTDTALDGRVRGLELARRRIEAELAVTVAEIDRRRSYADDGHRGIEP